MEDSKTQGLVAVAAMAERPLKLSMQHPASRVVWASLPDGGKGRWVPQRQCQEEAVSLLVMQLWKSERVTSVHQDDHRSPAHFQGRGKQTLPLSGEEMGTWDQKRHSGCIWKIYQLP